MSFALLKKKFQSELEVSDDTKRGVLATSIALVLANEERHLVIKKKSHKCVYIGYNNLGNHLVFKTLEEAFVWAGNVQSGIHPPWIICCTIIHDAENCLQSSKPSSFFDFSVYNALK